jgi:cell division transport system ATP-binding protein
LFATHDRSLLDVRPRRVVVLDEGRAFDAPNGLGEAEILNDLATPVRGPKGRGAAA